MKLKIYNNTTNKNIIIDTIAKLDIDNLAIKSAILKSLSNVHKQDFNCIEILKT